MANNKQEKTSSDQGNVLFSWTFSEFAKHDRSRNWYVWASVAVGALLLYAIFAHNYIFGLVIIIAGLTIAMFHRSDNEITVAISEDGILVNSNFYEYKSLRNFFIIYQPPLAKTLYFQPKNILNPRIPAALVDQDPVAIRKVLLRYLPEDLEQEDEPLSDQISRFFKL